MQHQTFTSPIGKLHVVTTKQGVLALTFGKPKHYRANNLATTIEKQIAADSVKKLRRYFRGDTAALNKIKVAPQGTAFQKKVWRHMQRIKPGSTKTYGKLAREIGHSKAARAVGTACKNNPICLIIPCHRVIGADGSLGGFNAGVSKKRFLLRHEAVNS